LTLVVAPGKSLSAQIFHDRQRLQSESAARLLEVFGRILTEIANDPTRQLDELLNSLDEPPDLTESYPKDELEQFSFHT